VRFAKNATGQDVLISEWILSIDEKEIKAVAKAEVLEAVVEEKGVGLIMANGMAGGFDAVGIHEDGNTWEVAGEHEGFVTRLG
jgi:hypothetical protein